MSTAEHGDTNRGDGIEEDAVVTGNCASHGDMPPNEHGHDSARVGDQGSDSVTCPLHVRNERYRGTENTVLSMAVEAAAGIDGSAEYSEDEESTSSQANTEDVVTTITSMNQLIENYFGNHGAYRPRYSYAQAKLLPVAARPSSSALDDSHIAILTHDCILHCLAPHEILALWQTSKTTWESMVPKQRLFIMMRSVFGYLRISEETAQHVDKMIVGGWRAYCPLMLSLCEHLARVYWRFEPDTAHRVFMAHQACFYPKSRGFWRCGSELAEHEVRLARALDFQDRHIIHYSQPTSKLLPPTMDLLKMDSHIGWGDAEPYFEREAHVGGRRLAQLAAVKSDSLQKHHAWMREHASDAPNQHYRLRLEQGISPCICVDQSAMQLAPGVPLELQLWALGIGPKRQQFLAPLPLRQPDERQRSFDHCVEYDPSSLACVRGGFMELILRRSHSSVLNLNREYDDACWPTMGILIWCMRRGLEPLDDVRIDWKALIDEVCRADSDLFRRFYREGFVAWDPFGPHPPSPDPVDHAFVERERNFYLDAITSPLFGSADFHKYV